MDVQTVLSEISLQRLGLRSGPARNNSKMQELLYGKSIMLDYSGRPTERWDATTPEGGYGSLWYDPQLNFITKVSRTSKSGVQSGYELQNAKQESLPANVFEVPNGFRKFTLTRFADLLAGLGQW